MTNRKKEVLKHVARQVAAFLVALALVFTASDTFRTFVQNHTALAAYVPIIMIALTSANKALRTPADSGDDSAS